MRLWRGTRVQWRAYGVREIRRAEVTRRDEGVCHARGKQGREGHGKELERELMCAKCQLRCDKPLANEYIVHRCGDGPQWCAHLGTHLPNLGLHPRPGALWAVKWSDG